MGHKTEWERKDLLGTIRNVKIKTQEIVGENRSKVFDHWWFKVTQLLKHKQFMYFIIKTKLKHFIKYNVDINLTMVFFYIYGSNTKSDVKFWYALFFVHMHKIITLTNVCPLCNVIYFWANRNIGNILNSRPIIKWTSQTKVIEKRNHIKSIYKFFIA